MALDIFSNFDDHNKTSLTFLSPLLMWTPIMLMSSLKYWMSPSPHSSPRLMWTSIIHGMISQTLAKNMGMAYSFFISWSMIIMWFNLMGLIPYVFSLTSHLAMNFSLALPMWLSMVFMSLTYNTTTYLSHFQPLGSPSLLNPFLNVIELISNLVRPLTLSVRLAANLSTGHIMLALLGGAYVNSSMLLMTIILIVGFFYTFFEGIVCIIQTYIFTLLPTLYSDEHPTNSLAHPESTNTKRPYYKW